jgi:hypothetical protein
MTKWKKGMSVFIKPKCPATSGSVSVNDEMKTMMGKTYKISSIRDEQTVLIGGWVWHINDLLPPEISKPLKPELFDPANLIT